VPSQDLTVVVLTQRAADDTGMPAVCDDVLSAARNRSSEVRAGAWVCVGRGFLHATQRDSGIKRGCDEGVPQCVPPDGLGDPGAAGDATDDPCGAVPVQVAAVCGQEDRSFAAFADVQVDRPGGPRASGMVTTLPPSRVITRVRRPR
jgi:hypothetical protein